MHDPSSHVASWLTSDGEQSIADDDKILTVDRICRATKPATHLTDLIEQALKPPIRSSP
jgi:hypothetical protein